MATLSGRQPNQTYGNLLQVDNSNSGVDGTYRDVEDGGGTASGLQLSTAGAKIPSGKELNVAGTIVITSASWTGKVPVANGGTNAATAGSAKTNLGLGTADSPQFTAVNIGHASDTTLARSGAGDLTVEGNAIYRAGGTDVPLTDGGTGASSASSARTNLGLAIGTNVQAYDAELAALAGLTSAANKLPYFTGSGTAALADITADGRTFLALADTTSTTSQEGLVEKATTAEVKAETADKFPDSADMKHHPGIAKAVAVVTVSGGTPTLNSTHSYNITSITDAGVGTLTITIANDFSDANWCAHGTARGTQDLSVAVTSIAAGSVTLTCVNDSGTLTDPSAWYFAGFGVLA